MRIIKYIIFGILSASLFSCIDGEDGKYKKSNLLIKNESLHDIFITTYSNEQLNDSIVLGNNQSALNCNYMGTGALGYQYCEIDSIKFTFNNNKGYICVFGRGDNSFCFPSGETPFESNPKFVKKGNRVFEFTITQEDYENAQELP